MIILAVLLKGHIAAAHKVGTYTTELLVLDHLSLDTNGEVTIDVEERLADEKVGFLLNFLLLSVLNFLIRFTLTDMSDLFSLLRLLVILLLMESCWAMSCS